MNERTTPTDAELIALHATPEWQEWNIQAREEEDWPDHPDLVALREAKPVPAAIEYDTNGYAAQPEGWGWEQRYEAELAAYEAEMHAYLVANVVTLYATLTNTQRATLPADAKAALDHHHAIQEAAQRIRVQDAAKAVIRAEKAAELVMPEAFKGSAFMRLEAPADKYLVDELWPTGGNVLFAAQRKAGKSTAVHNLVRSLLDGDPFLDTFTVGATKRVALLDFELGTPLLQEWLGAQAIENMDNLCVIPMRGRAGSFDILDDTTRAKWARMLSGYDVLIVDPLRPILHALGLNEWNETGGLLGALDALKVEAGIGELLLVQHHGHHAERAAGDSNLLGWSDANWDLTRENMDDPRSFRFFSAYGRDVDVEMGLVSIYDGKRLAFAAEIGKAKNDRAMTGLVEWIESNPGKKVSEIQAAGIRGVSKNTISGLLDQAVVAGLIRYEEGARNAKHYYPQG